MSVLSLTIQALGFDDDSITSNPDQVPIRWRRSLLNIPVENPSTQRLSLDPGATTTVLDGSRTLTIDGTTAFSIGLSPIDATRYRVTWTGGANPGFRTDRGIDLSAKVLTLVVNANQTVTLSGAAGGLSAVAIGDTVFIPGTSSGDAPSPFNALNEGYWSVLTADANSMTLTRAAGEVFSGWAETVTPASADQIQAFSSAGVQIGDTVDISAGFAAPTQRTFDLVAVNPKWIEFQSTAPLGAQSGILPTAAGLAIYTSAKRFLFIESDQEVVVRQNGATDSTNRVSPFIAGSKAFAAPYVKVGPVWKLVLVNRSSVRANIMVASAE